MRGTRLIGKGLPAVCIAAVLASVLPARAQQDADVAAGQRLVLDNCARCHATGRTGDSPHPVAPPFRTLSKRYPISALDEALVEGLSSGHPDMPEFVFSPDEAASIIAYLQSIQDTRR